MSDQQGETPQNDNQSNAQGGTPQGGGETPLTFDTWRETLDEQTQGLLDSHISGLRTALSSERDQRKQLARELKEAARGASEETQQRLQQLSGRLSEYEQQVEFYEAAIAAGVSNPRLAYLAAREGGFITDKGLVKMEGLKAAYPELFRKAAPPPTNGGAGTQSKAPAAKSGMNEFIRRSAGRT